MGLRDSEEGLGGGALGRDSEEGLGEGTWGRDLGKGKHRKVLMMMMQQQAAQQQQIAEETARRQDELMRFMAMVAERQAVQPLQSPQPPAQKAKGGASDSKDGQAPPAADEVKISKSHEKALQKQAEKFEKRAIRKLRLDQEIDRTSKQIAVLVDKEQNGRYPAGIKACVVASEFESYSTSWSLAVGGAYTFEIPLYQGITRANAIKAIHHACTLRCKQIEEEAQKTALVEIKAEVCQTLFVETCTAIPEPDLELSCETDLGLDLPAEKNRPSATAR